MKKNDLLTGFCEQIGYNGEGIFHIEGTTFFVPYCLVGEKVRFKILKIKGNIGYGKAEEILEKSPDRITPCCPVFTRCGGCDFLHVNYRTQLKIKEETVVNTFKKVAFSDVTVNGVYHGDKIFGYRNKLQLPVREQNGKVKIGFFRENTHDVVETDDCKIQPDWAKIFIAEIKRFVDGVNVTAYNDADNTGLLRHVVVRELNNEFILVLVINGERIAGVNGLIDRLLKHFPDLSVYINVNKTATNVIFGEKFTLIYGKGKISLDEFGITYRVGAESFLQVNTEVKKMLYEKVVSEANVGESHVVIDGYSGAGVMTAMLTKNAVKSYGVEIVKEASDSANLLAVENGLSDKMTSIAAPCEEVLPDLIEKACKDGLKTVLVLDPPRKGVELNVLLSALKAKVDKIIYVACSPQSLARDVGVLTDTLLVENGRILGKNPAPHPTYNVDAVYLYDMFPQTKHVETLVCLTRKPDLSGL